MSNEKEVQDQEIGKVDTEMVIFIKHKVHGELKVIIDRFAAFDGLEFRKQLKDYHRIYDKAQRRAYMVEVMAYASVVNQSNEDGRSVPFNSITNINAYFDSWEPLELVFNQVLKFNGIDPEFVGDRDREEWEKAGFHVATSFLSSVNKYYAAINAGLVAEQIKE